MKELAEKVESASRAMSEAIDDEQAQKAWILSQLVEDIAPALKGISSRILSSEDGPLHAFGNDGVAPVRVLWYPERGVLLASERGGVLAHGRPQPIGGGKHPSQMPERALFLLERGAYAIVDYEGEWIRESAGWTFATATFSWASTMTFQTPAQVAADRGRWHLGDIANRLEQELGSQLGGKVKATARIKRTAEKLHAIATLLDSR